MVNIFIPFSDPIKIAKVLDDKRLGKQRVEAKQIITIIDGEAKSKAWCNHPVVLMWKGYSRQLKYYYNCIVQEWIKRGYVNNMELYGLDDKPEMPWFMNNKSVLLSFQASLLRKNYDHYHKYFKDPRVKLFMGHSYLWVVQSEHYLTAKQIDELKAKPNKIVNIDDFAYIHEL